MCLASHWFPYVKKRILIIHQEQFELSPIQVSTSSYIPYIYQIEIGYVSYCTWICGFITYCVTWGSNLCGGIIDELFLLNHHLSLSIQCVSPSPSPSYRLQVAIEAMDKKTRDMAVVVKMDPPDVKRLQLLLAGSISTQVNQGIQEYIAFLKDPTRVPPEHIQQLKQMYRCASRFLFSLHDLLLFPNSLAF